MLRSVEQVQCNIPRSLNGKLQTTHTFLQYSSISNQAT